MKHKQHANTEGSGQWNWEAFDRFVWVIYANMLLRKKQGKKLRYEKAEEWYAGMVERQRQKREAERQEGGKVESGKMGKRGK